MSIPTPPPYGHSITYDPNHRPGVILWYRIYLGLSVFFCLLAAALGGFFLWPDSPMYAQTPPEEHVILKIMGGIYLLIGLLGIVVYLIPFFLGRKPWVWIYHLVMICLGIPAGFLIASIPLLIFWLKPEVKAYYGRQP